MAFRPGKLTGMRFSGAPACRHCLRRVISFLPGLRNCGAAGQGATLLKRCHLERSPKEQNATEDKSKDPEDVSLTMLIQGVFTMLWPRKRISRPQVSARSRQRGLVVSISAIFFSRRQRLSCFSLLIAFAAWSKVS